MTSLTKVLPSRSLRSKETDGEVKSMESPDSIINLAFSFWHSALLLNAVEMDLFTVVAKAPNGRVSNAKLRENLALNERAVPNLTDALVSMGLLERLGSFYCNSKVSSRYLVKGKSTYVGDLLDSCSRRVYREMINVEDSLRDPVENFEDVGVLMETHMREATLRSARAKTEQDNDNKSCASTITDGSSVMDNDLSFIPIIKQAYEFYPSRILLAAADMGLFTLLEQGQGSKMTCQQISNSYGMIEGRMKIFLRTLVAFKMLTMTSEKGKDVSYSNTRLASTYLVRSKESYVGGVLEMCSKYHYRYWSSISLALSTGNKQIEGKKGKSFSESVVQRDGYDSYLESLSIIHASAFRAFAKAFDFKNARFLLDLGGATGLFASCVASENKRIRCMTSDLPCVQPLAERHLRASGQAHSRVMSMNIDFLKDDLPRGVDVITMNMVMHERTLEERTVLVRKTFEALPARTGVLVIIDYVLENQRFNEQGLFVSLNMVIETGSNGGSCFTHSEMNALCLEHGFRRTELLPLTSSCSAIVAYK
jgi:hypothetical protein